MREGVRVAWVGTWCQKTVGKLTDKVSDEVHVFEEEVQDGSTDGKVTIPVLRAMPHPRVNELKDDKSAS